MVYQDNRIITLNSQDGEKVNGTYLSSIKFNFSGLLQDDIYLIRTYITVLNAQFPVSYYIIDDTNNPPAERTVLILQAIPYRGQKNETKIGPLVTNQKAFFCQK
jgi:hypothetical protein